MNQRNLTRYFQRNPGMSPWMDAGLTKIFRFGLSKDGHTHYGVITAYHEPQFIDNDDRILYLEKKKMVTDGSVLVGFSFCDPRDQYDRTEAKRGLLRLRSYGSVKGEGHKMKIRNSKFVVEIKNPSIHGAIFDVTEAFNILQQRYEVDPTTRKTRKIIPVTFQNWFVTSRTYTNKNGLSVSVPTILSAL